ncbi:MAG: glycosyltransferase family 4 protein [Chloroflexi bacterium]|nr:glycosyltransferase family 4 protein [Chloroflexota bacterium]
MRIALVTTGGVTSFFKDWPEYLLGRALVERGHDVICYTYREPGSALLSNRQENIDGIRVHRARYNRFWFSQELAQDIILEARPDVVHVHHLRNCISYEAISLLRRRHVPVVLSPLGVLHDPFLVDDRDYPLRDAPHFDNLIYSAPKMFSRAIRSRKIWRNLQNYLLHSALRRADKIIALSAHEAGLLRLMGVPAPRISVVPLWIDTNYIESISGSPEAQLSRPAILFVGQLKYRKGFDILAKAMPFVVREHPNASFVFVGHNTRNEPALRGICQMNGTEQNLRIAGRVSEEEKIRLFRECDAYALPTRYEGFGLPLLEAMAAGCPVISSKIPVVDEIIQDGSNGLLAELENPESLASKINMILDDGQLRERLVQNGRRTVRERYDEEALVRQILGVYVEAGSRAGT